MEGERVVAGLRCTEVLARLSDYVDGELAPDELTRVKAHVAGCDVCERFGGRFAAVVRGLREAEPPDVAPAVADALARVLERER
jgi:anti-sigma factor RsiW